MTLTTVHQLHQQQQQQIYTDVTANWNNNNYLHPPQYLHCDGDVHRDYESPPDTDFNVGYYCAAAAAQRPLSSSTTTSPYCLQHFTPPNETHDCYGVPARPSVAAFPIQAQHHDGQHHDPHYALQQLQLPTPQQHTINSNNNNNNNNLSPQEDAAAAFTKNSRTRANKHMRKIVEKRRRTKFNTCINELSRLVPLISNAPKKIQKTCILRLSAAYLRLNKLLMELKERREEMPLYIGQVNLSDIMLDDRDIFIMVTSAGKIVFISHSVETILGHPQIDLMGQSLFSIAYPEDHDELRDNLQFKEETTEVVTNSDVVADNASLNIAEPRCAYKMQRRSFYLRMVKKTAYRGDQPELKLVHVVGTLMLHQNTKNSALGGTEVVLNAVVRPFNERRVTEVSVLEATREEYITRHRIDGRIIYVDQRISIVSGFMPEEVIGQLAFTYMHKDDVRWVMIALRQMYFKGLSYGSSCYRLLSKNGEFVYMKTYGYLELNSNEDTIGSFICVNTLVSEREGKMEIMKMKNRFTPLIRSQSEPGIAAITAMANDNESMENDSTLLDEDGSNCYTEDLKTLNKFVEQIIINIPKPAIDNIKVTAQNPGALPDSQYMKVALLSKSMPPVPTISSAPKIAKRLSLSPQPVIKSPNQDRPSVLRMAPPAKTQQPVIMFNHSTSKKATDKDRENFERRGDIFVIPKRHNDLQLTPEHCSKKAKIDLETQLDSPTCSQYRNQIDGLQSDFRVIPDSCSAQDRLSIFQSTPIQLSTPNANDFESITNVNMTDFNNCMKMCDNNGVPLNPVLDQSYNSFDDAICNEGSSTDIIHDSKT